MTALDKVTITASYHNLDSLHRVVLISCSHFELDFLCSKINTAFVLTVSGCCTTLCSNTLLLSQRVAITCASLGQNLLTFGRKPLKNSLLFNSLINSKNWPSAWPSQLTPAISVCLTCLSGLAISKAMKTFSLTGFFLVVVLSSSVASSSLVSGFHLFGH